MCILYNQRDATYTMRFNIISDLHVSGKLLPKTCSADSKIYNIFIVASSWSFMLFTYIDDALSNTNQM